ncbi:hypothetical protein CEXT_525541 [Caerostris extrusa]|uniref:Uncharacterized protein n=1 Tax=Caerostris extrusa TaxID=172846 RepID=A0AAV4Y130_CAEEX|nr:hypothetical protein CEXT_525541 [Caerostris extrusa]
MTSGQIIYHHQVLSSFPSFAKVPRRTFTPSRKKAAQPTRQTVTYPEPGKIVHWIKRLLWQLARVDGPIFPPWVGKVCCYSCKRRGKREWIGNSTMNLKMRERRG